MVIGKTINNILVHYVAHIGKICATFFCCFLQRGKMETIPRVVKNAPKRKKRVRIFGKNLQKPIAIFCL